MTSPSDGIKEAGTEIKCAALLLCYVIGVVRRINDPNSNGAKVEDLPSILSHPFMCHGCDPVFRCMSHTTHMTIKRGENFDLRQKFFQPLPHHIHNVSLCLLSPPLTSILRGTLKTTPLKMTSSTLLPPPTPPPLPPLIGL